MPQEIKKFKYLVFIGRFQLLHNGHLKIICKALELSEYLIIVLGSAYQPRTIRNPFTVEERIAMITNSLSDEESKRVIFTWARDYLYNEQRWVKEIQNIVYNRLTDLNSKIGIIGHKKDETSGYLNMFPQWEFVEMGNVGGIHATELRKTYFEQGVLHKYSNDIVPISTREFLNKWIHNKEYLNLKGEQEFIDGYKKQWSVAPYPVTFVTTDAVVVQSGHVLMVKRKANPGNGLFALPGGFLGYNEVIVDSMIRELKEETKIKVPIPVLKGNIKANHVFDHPQRSQRGRTITHAFLIELPNGPLEKVKGGDDAVKAFWISLDELEKNTDKIFEDHFDIVSYLIGSV